MFSSVRGLTVIGLLIMAADLGFWGLFWEPIQKRLHPSNQKNIMTGRSTRVTALLCTCMLLCGFKTMPAWSSSECGIKPC